jgi:YVTN family beta-propeller protein
VINGIGGHNGVAVNPVTNKIYVNTAGELFVTPSNLTVIDGATDTVETTIEGIFGNPRVNPVTNRVYVIEDNDLRVIDGTTNAVVATVANVVPDLFPIDMAINPDTNMIYLLENFSSTITVIDGATNTATAVVSAGDSPQAMAVNPVTNKIYVVNVGSRDVTVIDGATNTVGWGDQHR